MYTVMCSCWPSWYASSTMTCLAFSWQIWRVSVMLCGISRLRFVQRRYTKTLPIDGIYRRTWASNLNRYGSTQKQTPCSVAELRFQVETQLCQALSIVENTAKSKTLKRNLAMYITTMTTENSRMMSLNVFALENNDWCCSVCFGWWPFHCNISSGYFSFQYQC